MNMFQIKVIAIISMLIDHFLLFFFPQSLILHILGRISFPLIAWLVANGARHTHDIDEYLIRLFGFGLLAQIPFEIGFYLSGYHPLFLNVLFTLFLGLVAIRSIRQYQGVFKMVLPAACVILAALLNTDYGAAGVLSIIAFYLFFEYFPLMLISQAIILFALPFAVSYLDPRTALDVGQFYLSNSFEGFGLLALAFIHFYNGERGARLQYFFYWFFPLQGFAILLMKLFISR